MEKLEQLAKEESELYASRDIQIAVVTRRETKTVRRSDGTSYTVTREKPVIQFISLTPTVVTQSSPSMVEENTEL